MSSQRDYALETKNRVDWIKKILASSNSKGVVFGNSGGKDSALVGILCKMACDNVLGIIMPCGSKQNYASDKQHAEALAEKFGILSVVVDLTDTKNSVNAAILASNAVEAVSEPASRNINPRLRMTVLYAAAQTLGCLVAGTGNKSEYFTGYFTKWGDGGYDLNPIADLTATEVFEFLKYLGAPDEIISKAPSAGLYEGQTDEGDMGVTYAAIDEFIKSGTGLAEDIAKIRRMNDVTAHKRRLPLMYPDEQ